MVSTTQAAHSLTQRSPDFPYISKPEPPHWLGTKALDFLPLFASDNGDIRGRKVYQEPVKYWNLHKGEAGASECSLSFLLWGQAPGVQSDLCPGQPFWKAQLLWMTWQLFSFLSQDCLLPSETYHNVLAELVQSTLLKSVVHIVMINI